MIKILFICHGNICRSTMAQSIFQHLASQAGLAACFRIDSAATSREEIGNPPHPGTVRKLREKGILTVSHRARQMTRQDYAEYDYLIGMDQANIRNMLRIADGDSDQKIHKLMEFSEGALGGSQGARDVADPWYTGDFETTYRDVMEGCRGFLAYVREHDGL